MCCDCFSVSGIRVNPCNSRIFAEPCTLSFCVSSCCGLDLLDGLVKRDIPIEGRYDFLVSDSLRCGDTLAKAFVEQSFNLADETTFDHVVYTPFDSLVEYFWIDGESDKLGRNSLRNRCEILLLDRIRCALFEKLKCPDHASYVVRVDNGRAFGIALA